MAYTNKVSAVAAVLSQAVAIALWLAEAQSRMHDLPEKCFVAVSDLNSATKTQVTCLYDNYIPNPVIVNITRPYSSVMTAKYGVFDKFFCNGTSIARTREIPIAALQSGSTSLNYFPRRGILTSGHRLFNQYLLEGSPSLWNK